MTKLTLSLSIIFISFLMLSLNNPLSMGLMILIQTVLISMILGMIIKTYWFSYILFLVFMGGLLVLFIYVSSIASNELFNPNFKMKWYFFMWMMFMIMIQWIMFYNLFWMNLSFNLDMNNMMSLIVFMVDNNNNKINLNKLYNNQNFMIMIMLMIYLFITLIVVVKITNIFYGPIRSKI